MPATDTYARRIEKYQRRAQLCLYFAGGLGGIGIYGAGDVTSGVFAALPGWIRALFFTLALAAGALLALGYGAFVWATTVLERHLQDASANPNARHDDVRFPRPRRAELYYRAGTILVVCTGGWLLVAVWLAAFAPATLAPSPAVGTTYPSPAPSLRIDRAQ